MVDHGQQHQSVDHIRAAISDVHQHQKAQGNEQNESRSMAVAVVIMCSDGGVYV